MHDSERKRLTNVIFTLANFLVFSNAMMFRFASDPNIWTVNATIIYWIVFISAVIAVNAWVYFSYFREPKQPSVS